jgi:uncharacterized protein
MIQSIMQQYPRPMSSSLTAYALRLTPGQDLQTELLAFVKANKLQAVCVVSCVGSLEQAALRFANQPDVTILPGKFEIVSLVGTLGSDASHLHLALADSTGKMVGGHVKEGNRIFTTAEIVLAELPKLVFSREVDSTYGYKELSIRRR